MTNVIVKSIRVVRTTNIEIYEYWEAAAWHWRNPSTHTRQRAKTGTYGFKLFKIIRTTLQVRLVQATCKVLCLSIACRGGLEGLLLNRSRWLSSRCRVGSTKEHMGNSVTNGRADRNRTGGGSHLCKHPRLTGLGGRCRWCGCMSRVCVRRLWGHSSSVSTPGLLGGSSSWPWCRTRGTRRTLEKAVNKMRGYRQETYGHDGWWW